MGKIRLLLILIAGLLLVEWVGCDFSSPLTAEQHPAVGQKLPEVDLQPLTGGSQPITAGDLAGRVTLINFWGAWCPPCCIEAPHIAALEREFRGRADVLILPVSCGGRGRDDLDLLRQATEVFLHREGLDMPTYADAARKTRGAFESVASFDGFPTTLLLDRDGVIRAVWVGYVPGYEHQMKQLLTRLAAEKEKK